MITVISGSEDDISLHCHELASSSSRAIILNAAKTSDGKIFLRHNANLRDLLAKLRQTLGSNHFEKIVLRHRVPAAFLLNKIYESLNDAERQAYSDLATSLNSHTSHNWFTVSFLVSEWARLIGELLCAEEIILLVPDLQSMDPTFIDVLRKILIDDPRNSLEVIVGFPSRKKQVALDENGILWDAPTFRNLRQSFATFDYATVCEAPARKSPNDSLRQISQTAKELAVDEWDGDPDTRIFSALQEGEDSKELLGRACEILDRVFGAYGFRSVLQLGLKLLERERALTTDQKSFIHAAVAISAHNRQFSSFKGNEQFNSFLEHHFSRALTLETDLIRRSAISYRFATTLARRKKNAESAIACVNSALDPLRSNLSPSRVRAYHEAWLLNIRAYAHMLLKNYRQSARDVEDAFMLAEEFWNNLEDASPNEIYSAQLFAGNRATLAMYGHDDEALRTWFGKGTGLFERRWDVGKRYVRFLRIILARQSFNLKGAVEAAREGLADAVRERSADYQDLYRMNLADLHYRLGELEPGLLYLQDAIAMYDKLQEDRRRFYAVVFSATVHARAGNLRLADSLYEKIIKNEQHVNRNAAVDLLSARAILAARQGHLQQTETLMDEAIEQALSSGERDLLLLVARRAGDCFLAAGDLEQARDSYERAIEISLTDPDEGVRKAPAGEVARACLGLLECGGGLENLDRMLKELPAGLEEDADLWWELPRILRIVGSAPPPTLFEEKKTALETLMRASSQRVDCQDLLTSIVSGSTWFRQEALQPIAAS